MKVRDFLQQLEDEKIVHAISEAEKTTSGEIRVYISKQNVDDALARAQVRFTTLNMQNTRDRNAVLIYVAPRVQKFAVIGDTSVHEKCGDAFWQTVTAAMTRDLQAGNPTAAIVNAVQTVGALLAQHFPPRADDRNELPNQVERD